MNTPLAVTPALFKSEWPGTTERRAGYIKGCSGQLSRRIARVSEEFGGSAVGRGRVDLQNPARLFQNVIAQPPSPDYGAAQAAPGGLLWPW